MRSQIIYEEPKTIQHKVNAAAKTASKNVPIFRGLDIVTYKQMVKNKYYPKKVIASFDSSILEDDMRNHSLSMLKLRHAKKVMDEYQLK